MKTEILSNTAEDLNRAAAIIGNGGLVVFPTETVYGLGADATNEEAVKAIYTAKGRPSDNPLIIHISDITDADKYCFTNSIFYLLAESFMPGPITVVLPAKDIVPLVTRGGLDTVGIRCPENKIAADFIRRCGVPIAAPSANLSGSPSPTNFYHVFMDMNDRVDAVINGGDCDVGIESTIVKVEDDSVTLLRPGKITVEDLESIGLRVKIADAVKNVLKEGDKVLSPGMKYKHYAPKAPLVLYDGSIDLLVKHIEASGKHNVAVITYDEDVEYINSRLPNADIFCFGKKEDEKTHAHLLFKLLRDTDRKNYDMVYAPLPGDVGIGLALYNRMIRAAAHNIVKL